MLAQENNDCYFYVVFGWDEMKLNNIIGKYSKNYPSSFPFLT